MKLSEFKSILEKQENIAFELPNGELVPAHFHVTEVGQISKRFIDCGGKLRNEERINFQLWEANDYDHRLHPEKLMKIINISEEKLAITDEEIEVEYQGATIEKFGLAYNGKQFVLTSKSTACLALDACGIPVEKVKTALVDLTPNNGCTPGGGCC